MTDGDDASPPLSDATAVAEDDVRERLERESGVVGWPDLIRHFARGSIVKVAPGIDVVEVAVSMAEDDTTRIGSWLADGTLVRAGDADAREWSEPGREFRCVVVAPWVLVQRIEAASSTIH